jgi:predicted Ser/Thr protein kinase
MAERDQCLTDDVLVDFASGQLPAAEAEPVEEHLAACDGCRSLVAETASLFDDVAPHTAPTAPESGIHERAAPLAAGAKLGRYRIEAVLGAGGMGVVYVAYDEVLRRKVALKLLHGDGASRARLVQEARVMARLSHPNVVAVHDAGVHAGHVFVVMELVDGRTLAQWLREERRAVAEVVEIFLAAGSGLAAAHAAGIVHRDFKPANVLVGHDGRVRVTDFGIARTLSGTTTTGGPASLPRDPFGHATTLVHTKGTSGTPAYMAPEQLVSGVADARSDQFAFGVALHEALHGVRPFAGSTREEHVASMVRGAVTQTPGRSVPAAVEAVVLRALRFDAHDRFSSVAALLDALRGALAAPRREPLPGSRRRRWLVAGPCLVVAAVVAVAVGSRGSRGPVATSLPGPGAPVAASGPPADAPPAIAPAAPPSPARPIAGGRPDGDGPSRRAASASGARVPGTASMRPPQQKGSGTAGRAAQGAPLGDGLEDPFRR